MAMSAIAGRRSPHVAARPAGTVLAFEPAPHPGLTGALCTAVEPEVFFPDPEDHEAAALAKGLCAQCPVREVCLAVALASEGDAKVYTRFGIWGGKDPRERYAISRRDRNTDVNNARRPVECGTRRGYQQHQRRGEVAYAACRLANAARSRRRRVRGAAGAVAA